MAWNNPYLSTPSPVGNYQGSAASTVLSDLSISGSMDVQNADILGTAAVTGAATLSSTLSVGGAATLTSGMLVGGASQTVNVISSITAANTQVTMAASGQSTEAFKWTGQSSLTDSDTILVGLPSGLSSGVQADAWVDSNASVLLRLSNNSTGEVVQTAQVFRFTLLDLGGAT